MYLMFEENGLRQYTPKLQKCGTALSVVVCFVTLMTFIAIFSADMSRKIYVVYLDGTKPAFTTDEKFLSIALDTSTIASDFKHFNPKDPKIIKMMEALSPAYLRIGGTMADRLTFSTSKSLHFKHLKGQLDGGECSYERRFCDYLEKPNFTMSSQEWTQLNELAIKTGLEIIFDLNALKRHGNGSWDSANAEKLIRFSSKRNFYVNWELGNEPNAYRHQFDYDVTPAQMADDFKTLKNILEQYPKYAQSLLIGPDVTRPVTNNNDSVAYLQGFLRSAGHVISAVTWHQYYFNGATATIGDFLNPHNFDILQWQIHTVKNIVQSEGVDKPIWLGETSSAYGGGAPHLSNRYIAAFLWLDKLGAAAKSGLSVVIRQTIFQGHYALINSHYQPTPDWWVSVLHKRLVGNKVVDCRFPNSEKVRLYCQCTKPISYYNAVPSVTVFGVNLSNRRVRIRFEGITPLRDKEKMENLKVHAYILTTMERIDSRFIFLNDDLLQLTRTNNVPDLQPETIVANPYVTMPPYSLAFWVVPITKDALPFC